MFFLFSLQLLSETCHSKNSVRCDQKCILVFKESTHYCQILMKLEFSRQILKKYSTIKFHKNPYSGSRVVPCGRTDMTKLTVAFCNSVNGPKKISDCNINAIHACTSHKSCTIQEHVLPVTRCK